VPIKQSLGAWTAVEQGALFARNVVAEHSSNPRMLVVHEVMGRNCGWLTAETARRYHQWVTEHQFAGFGEERRRWDVHGVFVPELGFDIGAEADRLRGVMDELGCVNLFVSEGAGVETILAELQSRGEEVQRDAFGHVKLDAVNPGAWFGKQFASRLGAEKTMVQKSGYFSRSAPSNFEDLALIKQCTDLAAEVALDGGSGVIGQDEERGDELRPIEFPRIKGGKRFDTGQEWFTGLLGELGQPVGKPVAVQH
jgi:pyrophosphate--fructose-6-phosphate 1-phosphotransferase